MCLCRVDSKDIERRREHWSQVRAIETKLSPSESRLFDPKFFFDKFMQKTKEDWWLLWLFDTMELPICFWC